MNKNTLQRELTKMVAETQSGRLKWQIDVSTTEFNTASEKPIIEAEGEKWVSDECFVSYHCEYKGEEFLMITYEMISKAGPKTRTTNLVFLPPLGVRVFSLNALLPYAVEADQMLTYSVHQLWMTILEAQKKRPEQIAIDANPRVLHFEDIGNDVLAD